MKAQIYCFHLINDEFYLIRDETNNKFLKDKFRGKNAAIRFAKANIKLKGFKGIFSEDNIWDFELNNEKEIWDTDGLKQTFVVERFTEIESKLE